MAHRADYSLAVEPHTVVVFDKASYRERNIIERCINRLKQWRRVATRYEKLAANYLAAILLAASMHFANLLL